MYVCMLWKILKYKYTGVETLICGLSSMIFTFSTKITALLNFAFPFIKNKTLFAIYRCIPKQFIFALFGAL